jgi:hypothetical protein
MTSADRRSSSKSELPTGTAGQESFPLAPRALDMANPLHQALTQLGKTLGSKEGAAPIGAASLPR